MDAPKIGTWMNDDDSMFCRVLSVTEPDEDGFFLVEVEIEGDPITAEFTPDEWHDFRMSHRLTID